MSRRGHGPRTAIVAALLAVGPAAQTRAQTPATVNVAVDATAAGTPLERVWSYHGYDEPNYSITAPGRALLGTLAAAHTAPTYVRTHFLLNTGNGTASLKWGSTNVYTEDAAGNPIYSWTLLDGILDAITVAGALPLNEIAFMPQAMTAAPAGTPYQNTGIYTLDGGCFYPPRDYTKWGALVRAWVTHVNARYPGVETSWKWELWNEPDIGYWHGTPAEFNQLYDYTEAAVHGVLPNAPVGGPAVASANGTFLTQFLQHCATGVNAVTGQTGTRLDLISFHAKGGVLQVGTDRHVQMNMGHQLTLHRAGFTSVAAVPAFRQIPIYITEADPDGCAACPISMTPADAYRNSPAYGAYEVEMMKRTLELEAEAGVKVGGVMTWAFTFPNTPYFAGYRALTTNGISLPVLGAFKLLGSLGGTRLPVTSSGALPLAMVRTDNNGVRGQADVDAMATLNGRQEVQVLVWNYHDDLVATAATPVHLGVRVPAGWAGSRVSVTHLRVDETHGDAYTVWVSQGSPTAPSPTQIAALQQAMEPSALNPTQVVDVTAGAVALDFDLPRFGISLVTLSPTLATADASVDAPVLADGGIRDVAPESGPGDPDGRPAMDAAPTDAAGETSPGTGDAAAPPPDAAQDSNGSRADASPPTDGVTAAPRGGCACMSAPARDGVPVPLDAVPLAALGAAITLLLATRRSPGRSRR